MKRGLFAVTLLVVVGLMLAACRPTPPTTPPPAKPTEAPTPVPPTPTPVPRFGSWVDRVVMVREPDANLAISRLEAGDIQVYAYSISSPETAKRIFELAEAGKLNYYSSYGSYNEITFNPAGPTFEDGRLNPFSSARVREAMNWLIDRDYIVKEIMGGLARPRFVPINYASKDSALLADVIAEIELTYAHNPEKAKEVIAEEMAAMGAELVDGKWTYNGEPVVIIALIRTEDERREIGDYVANLLEDIGFTLDRQYKTSREAAPCWIRSNPATGCFHFYTGGWVSTAIDRDAATNFSYFYTPRGRPDALWQGYKPLPELDELAKRLETSDFTTAEQRRGLMAEALRWAMKDSARVWLLDRIGAAPLAPNVSLASDLSGSIYGSWLWGVTVRYEGQEGGSVTIAMPDMMTQPWNPVAGSNWVYDMMPLRGMQSPAVVPDPFTGQWLPNRLARAEIFAEKGLPIEQNLDWAPLTFVDKVEVPGDAWADWDAEKQVFITAAEKFPEGLTAKIKVVMYYEDDYFNKMKWHDGSPVSVADHVMYMILTFDRAKEASAIYDESAVPAFETFMEAFKGWRIVSENPLVIEYYTDAYTPEADSNVTNGRAAHPSDYQNGEAGWHNVALGIRAEAAGKAVFSTDKSQKLEVEQLNYIAGPTLEILKAELDAAAAEGYIPYAPTLGKYITAEAAKARYQNLLKWYQTYGHFHISTGPFYLEKALPVEGTLVLQRFADFPDRADKWALFAEAPIPVVAVDGPALVKIGDAVKYDIQVEFNGKPYAVADISMVKFLVFDAIGKLAYSGEAKAIEDGLWQVELGADVTGKLAAGSNRLAVIVVSKRALVPITEVLEFVTQ